MTIQNLSKPQFKLVATKSQYPAMVAGFGAGKTKALISRALYLKSNYPNQNIAYYLPTFDLVRNIGFPRFSEELENLNARYKINKVFHTVDIENCGSIIFRSMDTPERIVGYEVADSLVDELDTLKTEQARTAWQKIIARNRQKKPDGSLNTAAVGTTPEGFRFVYEQWGRERKQGYELIKASTYSNSRNLPEGYIEALESTYPSNLLAAYLEGEFVNLTNGAVYPSFDRRLNFTNETIKPNEPLHIGMDFNVGKMAAVVHILRNDKPHAVMEYVGVLDTPAIIRLIKDRHQGHKIYLYPDATGKNREANNASVSDISLLRDAGFQIMANPTNPAVKDRILSMNAIIERRDYLVNPDTCPMYVEGLERQAYNKFGEPDKEGGFDHAVDAGGYFITYRYPIMKNTIQRVKVLGI